MLCSVSPLVVYLSQSQSGIKNAEWSFTLNDSTPVLFHIQKQDFVVHSNDDQVSICMSAHGFDAFFKPGINYVTAVDTGRSSWYFFGLFSSFILLYWLNIKEKWRSSEWQWWSAWGIHNCGAWWHRRLFFCIHCSCISGRHHQQHSAILHWFFSHRPHGCFWEPEKHAISPLSSCSISTNTKWKAVLPSHPPAIRHHVLRWMLAPAGYRHCTWMVHPSHPPAIHHHVLRWILEPSDIVTKSSPSSCCQYRTFASPPGNASICQNSLLLIVVNFPESFLVLPVTPAVY